MHYKGGKRCCQPSGIFQPRSMSCCRKFPPGNGESYDDNSDDDGDDDGDDNDDGDDDGDAVKPSQKCSRHLREVVFVR